MHLSIVGVVSKIRATAANSSWNCRARIGAIPGMTVCAFRDRESKIIRFVRTGIYRIGRRLARRRLILPTRVGSLSLPLTHNETLPTRFFLVFSIGPGTPGPIEKTKKKKRGVRPLCRSQEELSPDWRRAYSHRDR